MTKNIDTNNFNKVKINTYDVKLVKESSNMYNLLDNKILNPRKGVEVIEEVLNLSSKTREHFVILSLNTKNELIGVHTIHIGAINSTIVSVRDIFQQALLSNASRIMAFHNHPSGDTKPSPEDIRMTEKIVKAGYLMGVRLLDHIIIGDDGKFTSIKTTGDVEF